MKEGSRLCKRKAFVFDTNFIIENIKLQDVVNNLKDNFTVYVTQVSIDERISQKYLKLEKRYERINDLMRNANDIARISLIISLEEKSEKEKEFTQQNYVELFGENIIPFSPDEDTFRIVLNRLYKKLPPFLSIDGASDKGFKDSLIWISLLKYFKKNGEDDIIFVTNDNGFRKNVEGLYSEFRAYTGKNIIIKDNNYYKTLCDKDESEISQIKNKVSIPDVNQLRERIHNAISSLCMVYCGEDHWGNPIWERTFNLSEKVDDLYIQIIFSNLNQEIENNLFEIEILADKILGLDDIVINLIPIPMAAWEDALMVYEDIDKRLPDYLPQFYRAAATIINGNYIEQNLVDDGIPF